MHQAMQQIRARLHELLTRLRHHPSHLSLKEFEMLVLDQLEALITEVADIEAALAADQSAEAGAISTAVSSALSTQAIADEASTSTAVSSALSTQEATDQAALDGVTSSLSGALSQLAVAAGVSSSLSGVSSSVSVSSSLSVVSTSLSTTSTSVSSSLSTTSGLTVSPSEVNASLGVVDSVALTITGGTPPYAIDGLGTGQEFDPSSDTLTLDGTASAGSGQATVVDSSTPPLTTPITITTA